MKKNYIAPEFEELLIDSSEDILKSLEETIEDEMYEKVDDELLNGGGDYDDGTKWTP